VNNSFQFQNLYSSIKSVGATVLDGLWAWHPVETFFLGQSIGTDETNTFQFLSSSKIVGPTGLGGL